MALRPGHLTGVVVWRISPTGTTRVLLNSIHPSGVASVSSPGNITRWAKRPMQVYAADLFDTRVEARAEYRRRRVIAQAANPHCTLNFVSHSADQWETT